MAREALCYIYRNITSHVWSIRKRGKVIAKASELVIYGGASFQVSEAGRQRVLREKVKNVHAFVVCREEQIMDISVPGYPLWFPFPWHKDGWDRLRVQYNPYMGPKFTAWDSPIESTPHNLYLTGSGQVYIL